MKITFNPAKPLTDLRDVLNFIEFLHVDLKACWNPADNEKIDFTTYENLDNHQPSWSKAEGAILNQRMKEARMVCNDNDVAFEKFADDHVTLLYTTKKVKLINR